ncbi:MAG TPA: glutamate synthase, partial [Myxococcota bacterium]|nr:glutamate synthase [Myxococcota bacterium]
MLRPIPFPILLTRLLRELENLAEHRGASVFELPARRIWQPAGLDTSITHHGRVASTPFGPAAGPHTQLAQNFVPAWLAGARVFELKTVQARDDLQIPRPCIDMATVGYNIEWSQELTLAESAREYVKAMMLVTILGRGVPHLLPLPEKATSTLFDLSVGYDLAGLRSDKIATFLDTMRAPQALLGELLGELPQDMSRFARLPFPESVSRSVTLSTFHGCPPDEIERIAEWLLAERDLDVTIKLNPTLLGEHDLLELLHERLDYRDIVVPRSAFANDPVFDDVVGMVERLGAHARSLGKSFGIKFTNTLVVENHRPAFSRSE